LYWCYLQAEVQPSTFFEVRSRTEPKALMASVREAMKQIAPEEPIYGMNTMTDLVEYWMSPQKFNACCWPSLPDCAGVGGHRNLRGHRLQRGAAHA
jgi:hypothetical protein